MKHNLSPEAREHLRQLARERNQVLNRSSEMRTLARKRAIARNKSLEMRELARQRAIQRNHAGPSARARAIARQHAIERNKRTKTKLTVIERKIARVLTRLNLTYETERVWDGIGISDFYLPDHNLSIEADGTYWHSKAGRKERDARKDAELLKLGVRTLRLSEELIRTDMATVKNRIQQAIN